MKVCTFKDPDGQIKVGVLKGENNIAELASCRDMKDLIIQYSRDPDEVLRRDQKGNKLYPVNTVNWLAPVPDPEKMIFVGLNYRDHARETNSQVPQFPVLFAKFRNSLTGSGADVMIPEATFKCDYEAELAFIVGRTASNIPVEEAMHYIFGYTICNDVSARDLQNQSSQWLRGKAIDTFAPMGPCVVTRDEIEEPGNLDISCKINGIRRQNSNTRELIFNVPFLLSFLSSTMTLQPGDIISTGTPSGVITGMKDPIWLKDGDICEVEIEKIGVLKNRFVRNR